jgi:ABC-type multidrug transport system ATPase subunit
VEQEEEQQHMTVAIETRGLTKRYGDLVAVDHVDLLIEPGEVHGFLGPNGAGKTTTLKMLLGLVAPTSGTASVLGLAPGHPEALRRTGSMVESPAFYPYLSGRQNLELLARYVRVAPEAVDRALVQVGLGGRAADKFGTYSLGMKQRLGVAAALMKDPQVVIVDEPTNGLDPQGMRDMRELIARLGEQGRTVILSSHVLGEVQDLCDNVTVIDHGKVLGQGSVHELRGDAELEVTATPADRTLDVVRRVTGRAATLRPDGTIRVQVPVERAADIARAVVGAGLDLTGLRSVERELEDVFFEITGGREKEKEQTHA